MASFPNSHEDIRNYLEDSLKFLKEYSWIYNFPNTHVLVLKIFDLIPVEWVQFFQILTNEELNDLSVALLRQQSSPDSLRIFFSDLSRLRVSPTNNLRDCSYSFGNNSGLSKKKEHEIVLLAPLIHEVCEKSGCNSVLDVGAGLGYLPQLLYEKYKYQISAIEANPKYVDQAKTNQDKKYPSSKNSIQYIEHFVASQSSEKITEITKTHFQENSYCITGLHACADLSVTILELFAKLDLAKSLVIMPCCYHRLEKSGEGFKHFPASNLLKKLFGKFAAGEFLMVPFLRLACQTVVGFNSLTAEQHEEHANNCLFRAVLQEVAQSENCEVRRLKRKSGGRLNQSSNPFEAYLSNLQHTHTLSGPVALTDADFQRKMREKWTEHKGNCRLIEALTGLQGAIQSVCENIILLDRAAFLREQGVECFLEKVTDEGLSPRCHALVAVKP